MQYGDGTMWRNEISKHLIEMGVLPLDPYKKPFIKDIDEGPDVRKKLEELLQNENYQEVCRIFKNIRTYDLAMVDKSDFIIAYINPTVPTIGSIEEIVTAVRMKKPIFIFVEGTKKACPLWIFGMIPHTYIFNTMDEVIVELKKINSGEVSIDENRWRLFKEEFR